MSDPYYGRNAEILEATINGTEYTDPPQSRIEDLLLELKEVIEEGGGGGDTSAIEALLTNNACKNILPNNATSKTVNGITYTVNSDLSITASGTATADSYLNIAQMSMDEDLILSGCPENGSATTYFLYVQDTTTSTRLATDTGSGAEITASSNTCNVNICIRSGVTASDLVFYPMIRNEDTESGYETYYPTNVTLAQLISTLSATVATDETTLAGKQDTLTAGDNITISNNVISASGGGVSYSTEEQDTGTTWIDRKPIYQKTFTSTFTLGSSATIIQTTIGTLSGLGIDTLIKGVALVDYKKTYHKFVSGYNYSSNFAVVYFNNSNIQIYAEVDAGSTGTWYATLYYTKTTD